MAVVSAAVPTGMAAPSGPNGDSVCIGPDALLRVMQGDHCAGGMALLKLEGGSRAKFDQNEGADLRDRIDSLDWRLQALERPPRFTVVNEHGRPIFEIASGRVRVFNPGGMPVVFVEASAAGGSINSRSDNGRFAASMGTLRPLFGVRIAGQGRPRVELGRAGAGNFSLRFPSLRGTGGAIAGIGESRAGTGALVMGDASGVAKASLTITDGKGALGIFNDDGAGVLSLKQGATAGGLLAIGDAHGEPMAKMGVNEDRYGIVLTGPRAGFPLVPSSGLPGSYFLGCAGGESCKP